MKIAFALSCVIGAVTIWCHPEVAWTPHELASFLAFLALYEVMEVLEDWARRSGII